MSFICCSSKKSESIGILRDCIQGSWPEMLQATLETRSGQKAIRQLGQKGLTSALCILHETEHSKVLAPAFKQYKLEKARECVDILYKYLYPGK